MGSFGLIPRDQESLAEDGHKQDGGQGQHLPYLTDN